jgi:F-type H+-transporting ATPase subunit b
MSPQELILAPMGLIDVDLTFFIQLVLFLAFFVVMRSLVFKPVLASIELRADRTEKARREARALAARSEELAARYQQEMGAARAKAISARAALRSEGVARREAIVNEARDAAARSLEQVRGNVAQQFGAAREQMLQQVDDLARTVARKILGRNV